MSDKKEDETTNSFDRAKYWETRKHLAYYAIVEKYVRYIGRNANSLLDVGGTSDFIERFDWIKDLQTLDIAEPYTSNRVKGTKIDFFKYDPKRRFDVITCLQVLEHLDDPAAACAKFRELSDSVIVSVPYRWNPEKTRRAGHVQDPVDEKKLNTWMGQTPVDKCVVNEPFLPEWPRLVAWYWFGETPVTVALSDYRNAQLG